MDVDGVREGLKRYPAFGFLLTDDQIRSVLAVPKTYRTHPLVGLFADVVGDGSQVLTNTEGAVRALLRDPGTWQPWLRSRIAEAIREPAFSGVASALGEIRAAGDLQSTGLRVRPRPRQHTPQSDLMVSLRDRTAVVEVVTKLMNENEAKRVQAELAANERTREQHVKDRGIAISTVSIAPGGTPRRHETIGENVGQKFASLKPHARQSSEIHPSLLWVDIQDDDWWAASASHAKPVVTWKGEFTSGGIWHGFYGLRGTPTFERQRPALDGIRRTHRQTYPGLFSQHDRWAAAILSFQQSTVIFEHPSPRRAMNLGLRETLLTLPRLRYEDSWLSWPPGSSKVRVRVARARRDLENLAKRAKYVW